MNFFEDITEERLAAEAEKRQTNTLWVERYRPLNMDTFIGNEDIKQKIKYYIANKDIPHLLFFGKAGGGKTTLAKILVNNINCDTIYINASSENSVDTVREKITNFACAAGFRDQKIIILDECLDENTLVWILRDGVEMTSPIKDLQDDTDLVKSYNFQSDEIQWRPFNLLDKGIMDAYEIVLENGEKIICSSTHRWYVEIDGEIKVINTNELIKRGIGSIISK